MSASSELAEKIVTALEGRFRDWLMAGEHAEAKELVAEILERGFVQEELVARIRSISSALVRLHHAVAARMSADEPTGEQRLELLKAWEDAGRMIVPNNRDVPR